MHDLAPKSYLDTWAVTDDLMQLGLFLCSALQNDFKIESSPPLFPSTTKYDILEFSALKAARGLSLYSTATVMESPRPFIS